MTHLELPFIKFIIQAPLNQARDLFIKVTETQVTAIAEICYNLLYGDLEPDLTQDLKPYRRLIRELADKNLSFTQRRKLLVKSMESTLRVLRLSESILERVDRK